MNSTEALARGTVVRAVEVVEALCSERCPFPLLCQLAGWLLWELRFPSVLSRARATADGSDLLLCL